MLRRLAVVAALCLLPVGNAVLALGLGDIKVSSGLNQRFEATIPITSITPDEADSLKVTLADNDAFTRAGLDRAQYLSSLTLEAVTDDGSPYIRIESSQIVREPLLSILIEVRAGGPRILREYTVLLDPPGPESNVSRPYVREQAVPPTKKLRDVPPPSEAYQAAKAKAVEEAPQSYVPGTSKYGPLRVGDTLWSIANKVRPTGVPVAVEQVMLALYQGNPDGFVDGNPNTLNKGAMLTVPSLEAIRKTDQVSAKEQVRALMAGEPMPGPAASTTPDAAPTAPAGATTPGTAAPGVDGSQAAPATPTPGTDAAATTPAGTPGVDGPEAEAPAGDAAPAATPSPETAPVKRPPEPSMMSRLLPIFIALIVIAIGLVIWRSYRERRATREYEMAARSAAAQPVLRSPVSAMPKPMTARDELEEVNRRLAEQDATHAADDDRTVVGGQGGGADFETVAVSTGKIPPYTGPVGGKADADVASQFDNTTQIDLGANDPIAEADFHLAYGLYEEAALLLRQAAERDPGRTDVRAKLAETYFAAGKPAEFREVAESLKGQLGREEWGKLAIMGRQLCPDAPVFAGGGDVAVDLSFDDAADEASAATKGRVDDGLDFSLEELELPGKGEKGGKPGERPPLEFDLGEFDLAGATQATRPVPQPIKSTGELSLQDFDLAGSKGDKARSGLDIRLEDVHPDGLEDPLGETISAGDDVATKLDLARAYVEMGDAGMARTLLDEVATQGNDDQKREAAQLRERLLG